MVVEETLGRVPLVLLLRKKRKNEKTKNIARFGKRIGTVTNNEAEYQGVIEALTWVNGNSQEDLESIAVYLDSLIVCNQLKGVYKVKKAHLGKLLLKVRTLEQVINLPITYTYVPREKNQEADALVNEALDKI